MPGGLTHNDAVDELIGEYHAVLPPELTMNETDMLLAALLLELKAQRVAGGGSESVDVILQQYRQEYANESDTSRGTYHAESVTATDSEWYIIDLDFVSAEIDLRNLDGAVDVAFADPTGGNNVIRYDKTDTPLAGISIRTGEVGFKAVNGSVSLDVEVWS